MAIEGEESNRSFGPGQSRKFALAQENSELDDRFFHAPGNYDAVLERRDDEHGGFPTLEAQLV
jgi:hypothetical protein